MGLLVEDLLMLARLDAQRPMERGPVDLLAIASDAVHNARAMARAGAARSTRDRRGDGTLEILGDQTGCGRCWPIWSTTRSCTPRRLPRSRCG